MKIADVLAMMDEWAPFETAESFDNVGLLVGNANEKVNGIVVSLDATLDVIAEAVSQKANLIVTHHPVIFDSMNEILQHTSQGKVVSELIKRDISVISAHTNLDLAEGGVTCALAEKLKLVGVEKVQECEFMRIGNLETPMDAQEFAKYICKTLPAKKVEAAGPLPNKIKNVCVMAGSGGGYMKEAAAVGADVFLTGSIKHEYAVEAHNLGICAMAAGHYETEVLILPKIKAYLQKHANDVQSINGINITLSGSNPFDSMV